MSVSSVNACGRFEPQTQADCASSDNCQRWGHCQLDHNVERGGHYCRIGNDEHCRKSQACAVSGRCHARLSGIMSTDDWTCAPREDEDCRLSQRCKEEGLCGVEPQTQQFKDRSAHYGLPLYEHRECLARSAADCLQSERCAEFGECTLRDGRCYEDVAEACRQCEKRTD